MVTIRPMRRSEIKHFAILIRTIKIYLIKWITRVCLFDRKIRREIENESKIIFPKIFSSREALLLTKLYLGRINFLVLIYEMFFVCIEYTNKTF